LVVAGFLCNEGDSKRLQDLGVRDSKLIADNKLLTIAEQLRSEFAHYVLIISPEVYNQEYKIIKNLNKMLAAAHARVIENLVSNYGADRVVLDKFGKPELVENALATKKIEIELFQIEKGERLAPVAAASIMARAGFVRAMNELSKKFGLEIPKGASALVDEAGKRFVKKFGDKALEKIAKVHFKNYSRVLSPNLFN